MVIVMAVIDDLGLGAARRGGGGVTGVLCSLRLRCGDADADLVTWLDVFVSQFWIWRK